MALSISNLFLGMALLVPVFGSQGIKPTEGERLFKARCAPCHGATGEGGSAYPRPLTGNLSAAELAKFIITSMPPGPKKCPATDAEKIAPYIYSAFYSPNAQDRIRPARVALQRLTVPQFKNAVADLVGDFHPVTPSETPNGLKGEYFKGRDMNEKDRVFSRIDPGVKFDFGNNGPEPGKFDPHFFTIAWQGSVLAPDTGDYDFIIHSDQDVKLFVNGWKKPLIDAFVHSKDHNEFEATITLLGGRAYPIRLEFSKASQGVDDSAAKKGKPAPHASVELLWNRPMHATETIPSFCLYPDTMPVSYVSTTHFPPDDRSIGYERGSSVSKEWDDAETSAAVDAADYVADNLRDVMGVKDDDPNRVDRLKDACKRFVERAFRRPLTAPVQALYVDKQFAEARNPETAVKRVVMMTLLSPRFLYREIGPNPNAHDAYTTASQLSFGLWDTLPDPALVRAAKSGGLDTHQQIAQQADRMAQDPRAWNTLRAFLLEWLKVDEVPEIVKSSTHYPKFDPAVVSDLRTSLELFLRNTAWSESSDYREMMLSPTEYLDGRLAQIYGVNEPPQAPFEPVTLDAGARRGLLTNPYMLARLAYYDGSDPIHRGVLIVRSFLGRILHPPPAAFAPDPPKLHPDFTTRQRVAAQTKPETCNKCHGIINPLGFTLEGYDAIGRIRETDNGKPVDETGRYVARNGATIQFKGVDDLADYLANGDDAHTAFVEKLFQHLIKQPVLAYGPGTLSELVASFSQNRYSIRKLMSQIVLATTKQGGG